MNREYTTDMQGLLEENADLRAELKHAKKYTTTDDVLAVRAEVKRLQSRIDSTLSLLEDSDADDCDIYRLSCALQGKVW